MESEDRIWSADDEDEDENNSKIINFLRTEKFLQKRFHYLSGRLFEFKSFGYSNSDHYFEYTILPTLLYWSNAPPFTFARQ
jgi:hypothetical protein